MPISSRACPVGEPAVTSLRPSKLAIKVAGAAVVLPGTVIPSGVVLAEAAVTPRVPSAAAAARPAPIPRARRRLVVLIMLNCPSSNLRPMPGCTALWSCTQSSWPVPQPGNAEKLTAIWVNRIKTAYVALLRRRRRVAMGGAQGLWKWLVRVSASGTSASVGGVAALDRDLIGEVFRVVPDAPDEARPAPRQPRQAEEVDAGLAGHAALVPWPAVLVEGIDLQPGEVGGIAGRPDDRRDAGRGEVEFGKRAYHAAWGGAEHAGFRLFGEVESVERDVGVGFIEQREVVRIAGRDVVAQVGREAHGAVTERRRAADKGDALGGKVAEVDGVAAVCAAHRDGHVLGAFGWRGGFPLSEDAQPPDVVPPPVAPRGAVVRTNREVDLPARPHELGGYLHARGPGADHEDVTGRQLLRVAVGSGMNLHYAGVAGDDRRDNGLLEGPRRRDHEAGADGAVRRLHPKALRTLVLLHRGDVDTAADWSADHLRIGLEVVGDLLLRHEGFRIAVELQAREPVVPGGSVGHQRVPASGAPFLGNTPPLQDDVRHASVAQVLAHSHAGLAAANDDDFDLFDVHRVPSAGSYGGSRPA